ncbi:hypothetical protein GCM10020370_30450 [Paenibacillus hodogayensis]
MEMNGKVFIEMKPEFTQKVKGGYSGSQRGGQEQRSAEAVSGGAAGVRKGSEEAGDGK